MPTAKQELTPGVIDSILQETLPKLLSELKSSLWYVSEHAVVNLFVFGYLVPAFQKLPAFQEYGWDLTLMGMEASVLQIEKATPCKLGTRKDIVFWRQPRSTRWKGYDLLPAFDKDYVREHGCKPLAVVEWKNISRFTLKANKVKTDHERDVEWLRDNLQMKMLDLGYAILVDQRNEGSPTLACQRITREREDKQFLVLP